MDRPVSLVTGSRTGLRRAVAEHFLAAGHLVVGCSRKPADHEHERYLRVLADVGDESSVRELFGRIRRTYGRLDHRVANAGVASMNHSLLTPAATKELLCRPTSPARSSPPAWRRRR